MNHDSVMSTHLIWSHVAYSHALSGERIIRSIGNRYSCCSEIRIVPHTCIPHPSNGTNRGTAQDSNDFKWPQAFHKAPEIPQRLTKDKDNSKLGRAEVLNSFAGERWAGGEESKRCMYGSPSRELTEALKEHLNTASFLPSLLSELEDEKHEQGIDTIRAAVRNHALFGVRLISSAYAARAAVYVTVCSHYGLAGLYCRTLVLFR
jgi:hypothetical protein